MTTKYKYYFYLIENLLLYDFLNKQDYIKKNIYTYPHMELQEIIYNFLIDENILKKQNYLSPTKIRYNYEIYFNTHSNFNECTSIIKIFMQNFMYFVNKDTQRLNCINITLKRDDKIINENIKKDFRMHTYILIKDNLIKLSSELKFFVENYNEKKNFFHSENFTGLQCSIFYAFLDFFFSYYENNSTVGNFKKIPEKKKKIIDLLYHINTKEKWLKILTQRIKYIKNDLHENKFLFSYHEKKSFFHDMKKETFSFQCETELKNYYEQKQRDLKEVYLLYIKIYSIILQNDNINDKIPFYIEM